MKIILAITGQVIHADTITFTRVLTNHKTLFFSTPSEHESGEILLSAIARIVDDQTYDNERTFGRPDPDPDHA